MNLLDDGIGRDLRIDKTLPMYTAPRSQPIRKCRSTPLSNSLVLNSCGVITPKRSRLDATTRQQFGDRMLSKCANPSCSTTFRYLHEGKLYLIPPMQAQASHKPRCSSRTPRLEYAWLCSSCSLDLTIQTDDDFGMRVVRKCEAKIRPTSKT